MNAEHEMNTSDGLGGEPLDPCAQIAESVGYHVEGEGSMEALIAYKDALEDAVRRLSGEADSLADQLLVAIGRLREFSSASAEELTREAAQRDYDLSKSDPYNHAHGLDQ